MIRLPDNPAVMAENKHTYGWIQFSIRMMWIIHRYFCGEKLSCQNNAEEWLNVLQQVEENGLCAFYPALQFQIGQCLPLPATRYAARNHNCVCHSRDQDMRSS